MKNRHFDGNGHITLSFDQMLSLYADRKPSLVILRRFPPFKYLVIPDIEIHVKKGYSEHSYIVHRYPGEVRRLACKLSERSIDALRRLYKSGDLSWKIQKEGDEIIFFRPGQVIRKVDAVDYSTPSVGG